MNALKRFAKWFKKILERMGEAEIIRERAECGEPPRSQGALTDHEEDEKSRKR